MGGPIVFSMYEEAPERFDGMILIDTVAAPAPPPEVGTWRGIAEVVREMGVDAVPPLVMDEMLTGEARMQQPELVSYVEGLMLEASEQAAIAGAQALATRPDFRRLLGQIDVPTLILVGLQDTIYPYEISQTMQQSIAGSELVVLDNASHAAIIEAAGRANEEILAWVADVPAGGQVSDVPAGGVDTGGGDPTGTPAGALVSLGALALAGAGGLLLVALRDRVLHG